MPSKRRRTSNLSLNLTLSPSDSNSENNVKGTVEVDSKVDLVIHGIIIKIHGEIWTDVTCPGSSHTGDQKYSANIFVQSNYILGRGFGTIVFHKGKRSLPFTFCLPPHLPSSFEGTYGAIKYMITAQLHSDNERNDEINKVSEPLQVQRFLSLSDGNAYGSPISYPLSLERPQKTLRTTLVPNNNQLKFIFKVQKTGYATGEIIPFVLDLCNPEKRRISSISVTLVKKTTFSDLKNHTEVYDELAEVCTMSIDNLKSTLTWIGSLHVPQDTIPTHSVTASAPKKKSIFAHRYFLRVRLIPYIGACVSGGMSIVIGTTKYECRSRRQYDHCCRTYSATSTRENSNTRQSTDRERRRSSVPPTYAQALFNSERRPSLETLPPPYEEAIAMASRALAKETRHLMG